MKITKTQLRKVIKEEAKSLNENIYLAMAGQAIAGMLTSQGGRGLIAKVLRWPGELLRWTQGWDDFIADALGAESPEFLNKMQEFTATVRAGPFDYVADFIEGLDDEEAAALAGAMESTGMGAETTDAPLPLPMSDPVMAETLKRWKKLIK